MCLLRNTASLSFRKMKEQKIMKDSEDEGTVVQTDENAICQDDFSLIAF